MVFTSFISLLVSTDQSINQYVICFFPACSSRVSHNENE